MSNYQEIVCLKCQILENYKRKKIQKIGGKLGASW
jgi:predicted nucleic-acid-binding Zn-ribbon protein